MLLDFTQDDVDHELKVKSDIFKAVVSDILLPKRHWNILLCFVKYLTVLYLSFF